ncbi:Leukemia inhibitory factor receptor [Collichthys lucidus]|uniref:Leukemia inhibitory factor receptor n=1 Tax=Collichthys lucidus TaxID=240159 RepID=A0A4U5UIE9_COLLU|nr:Leukemia inhibitory factor receptor [Collichthys lucidus]
MDSHTLKNYLPLYLMETCCRSLHGFVVVFLFFTSVSKGSACEAPSSPQCFRRKADESIYICEWTMNRTGSDVTFDLYFNQSSTYSSNEKKFGGFKETSAQIIEEVLIKHRPIVIWVVARVGKSSCTSARRSVELRQTDHLTVVNLLKDTAYRVQIRHRSHLARNPLWSDWSPVVIVPAELEQKPEVTMTTRLTNGTRKVILTWKPMPHAAAVTGVTYLLTDTQSLHGCPCMRRTYQINSNKYTTYVSYSAVNITVMAKNAAGFSPPKIIQISAKPDVDLKACDKLLLDDKTLKKKKTCHELYKLQDGDSRPENVITLTARMKKKQREEIRKTIQDYVRYLYFEHICDERKPRTIKMCLFYQKEGVPLSEPQHFTPFDETQTSVSLSWKWIPSVAQQSFLTHYSLCIVKISSQDEPTDFTPYQPETQEMLEGKEEVHELTLCQLRPEGKCVIEDAGETIIFRREWDDGIDEDLENERGDSRMSGGTSDECLGPGSTDQALRSCREGETTDLDNEISMLIYRNGLVFDVKVDSP